MTKSKLIINLFSFVVASAIGIGFASLPLVRKSEFVSLLFNLLCGLR